MGHTLEVFQPSWAMEQRAPDGLEWTLDETFRMIKEAGYDGMSIHMVSDDFPTVEQAKPLFDEYGLENILVAFPCDVEDLKPVFAMANKLGSRFVAINAVVSPYTPDEGADHVCRSLALADKIGVEAHFERHLYTLTNGLFHTGQVMDLVPEMEIACDLSHAVVSREVVLPLGDVHRAAFDKVLKRCAGLQGRIATREQVQIAIDWPQHAEWVALFNIWWEQAIHQWHERKPDGAILNFLCELGSPPYGITGTDRWDQALILEDWARATWAVLNAEAA
ncbi:MAG: sugar phosphate isomerase/epimerase [Rhodospirillales bacterium]|nr:sugar phosphate isomerase/epimerase [Rhodospirillales bacterium]